MLLHCPITTVGRILSRSLISSTRKSFPPQDSLIQNFLLSSSNKHSEQTAFIDYVTKKSLTHGQCGEYVGKIANRLIDWGVKPGDHVALSAFNHEAYFPVSLGIISAGGTVTFCNPSYTKRETEQLYKTADVSRVIGHPKNSDVVNAVANKLSFPEPLDITKILGESDSYSSELPDIPMDIHDTCALFFSSGTTGFPKAVETTHDGLVSNFMVLDDPGAMNFDQDTVNNGFLPSFHALGAVVGMHVLHKGSTSVTLDGFQPDTFLGANQDHKVTFSVVVPPVMVFLAKHPVVGDYDLFSLRDLLCAAAPLSQQLEEDVKQRLRNDKLNIRQAYGMTEVLLTHAVEKGLSRAGCIGSLLPNTSAKVMDTKTGEEVGANEVGEILIKGPCIMKGYYNNPAANAETFTEEGFVRSGDVGYYNEEGEFYVVDRLKEFIKVKGFQVAPAELEALLLEHPKIADVAVIGIPDERAGERPKAFVVPHPNVELSKEDVTAFVADHTSEYKVPSEVEFTEVIPKLASGKIQRNKLRLAEKAKREGSSEED